MLSQESGRSSYIADDGSIGVPFDTYKMPSGKRLSTDVLHWKHPTGKQSGATSDHFTSPYDSVSIDADRLEAKLKD